MWFRQKTQSREQALGGQIRRVILHPKSVDRQRPKGSRCQSGDCFGPVAQATALARQHDSDFRALRIARSRLNCTQTDSAFARLWDDREKARSGRFFAGGPKRDVESGQRPCPGQRPSDESHRLGFGIEAAEQGLVILGQTAHAQARGLEFGHSHFLPAFRSSAASRSSIPSSVSSARAGGMTSVSGNSIDTPDNSPSATRSMRGRWIGSVAARYTITS